MFYIGCDDMHGRLAQLSSVPIRHHAQVERALKCARAAEHVDVSPDISPGSEMSQNQESDLHFAQNSLDILHSN